MFQDMKPQSGGSSTTQNKKYFGMTSQQVAILAGLAVAVLLLLVVGGWLILRGLPGSLAPVPQDTPVPQVSATPFVIPTLTLTPTLTPVPYEMLIPEGWVQFKTALVEIWLPKGFKSQKPKASDNPADSMTLDLEVVRPASKKTLYPVIVLVTYEPLTTGSLDTYLESLPAQLSTDLRVAAKRKVNINSVDAVLILLEGKVNGDDINDQVYIFLDGGTVWFVHYMAQINEFYEILPTFEQSIKTFRIVR